MEKGMCLPCFTPFLHTFLLVRKLFAHWQGPVAPLQNGSRSAHNGFKTKQCSERLNAIKLFKTVFFFAGCANTMAMCNKTQ